MGILDRLSPRNWFKSAAAGAADLVSKAAFQIGQIISPFVRHGWGLTNFRALATEGYKGNGVVFACVQALGFAFPEAAFRVWQDGETGGTIQPRHPAARILRRPNPQQSWRQLMQYAIVYMAVGGNAYLLKVRDGAGRVVELWPLHDGQMHPVPGLETLIGEYEIETGTGQRQRVAAADVVHMMWMPDPLQPWIGLAPLLAVAREVDKDNEASSYLYSLLKNDAMPRLALTVPPDVDLSPADESRLRDQWEERYGSTNRGRVALLKGGMDIKTIALNLRDLEFTALTRVPEARIAAAFRVPPTVAQLLVGLEQMTYNNVAGLADYFTEYTLAPLWAMMGDVLTAQLLPEFVRSGSNDDGSLTIAYDPNTVLAMRKAQIAQRTWAVDAFRAGLITRNEGRAASGFAPDARKGGLYVTDIGPLPVTLRQSGQTRVA